MKGFTALLIVSSIILSTPSAASQLTSKQLTRLHNDSTIDRFNFRTDGSGIVFQGTMTRSAKEPTQALINFAEQNAQQLGSQVGAKFKLVNTVRDQHNQLHVTLKESIHDLPVKLSEIKLHLNENGALTRVNGSRALNTQTLNDFMRQWSDKESLEKSLKTSAEVIAGSTLPQNTKALTIMTEYTYLSADAPHVRREITLAQQGATQPVKIIADVLSGKIIKVHSAVKLNIDPLAQQR